MGAAGSGAARTNQEAQAHLRLRRDPLAGGCWGEGRSRVIDTGRAIFWNCGRGERASRPDSFPREVNAVCARRFRSSQPERASGPDTDRYSTV